MGSVEHAERDREHQEEHQHALQMSCMVGGVLSPDAVQISLQPSCNAYVALRLTVIRERAIMEREGERRSKREKGEGQGTSSLSSFPQVGGHFMAPITTNQASC